MSVPDKLARAKAELEEKDSIRIRMRTLFERAFQFKEGVWGNDDKFWEEVERHPIRFKARFADMTNIFSKPWAARIMEEQEGKKAKERITADGLEELGLTDEQIEKLATVESLDKEPGE